MPGFELTMTFDDQGLSRKLEVFSTKIEDLGKTLLDVKDYLFEEFEKQWETEGSHLGMPWAPPAHEYGHPLMADSGELMEGFSWKPETPKDSITLFNPVPYFGYHQSSAPRVKLPRRAMMVLDDTRKEHVVKIFQKALQEAARNFNQGF